MRKYLLGGNRLQKFRVGDDLMRHLQAGADQNGFFLCADDNTRVSFFDAISEHEWCPCPSALATEAEGRCSRRLWRTCVSEDEEGYRGKQIINRIGEHAEIAVAIAINPRRAFMPFATI